MTGWHYPSTVTGIADRLEAKGLAERRRDSRDHRVIHMALTEKGSAVLAETPPPARLRVVEELSHKPAEELATFTDVMASLAEQTEHW